MYSMQFQDLLAQHPYCRGTETLHPAINAEAMKWTLHRFCTFISVMKWTKSWYLGAQCFEKNLCLLPSEWQCMRSAHYLNPRLRGLKSLTYFKEDAGMPLDSPCVLCTNHNPTAPDKPKDHPNAEREASNGSQLWWRDSFSRSDDMCKVCIVHRLSGCHGRQPYTAVAFCL